MLPLNAKRCHNIINILSYHRTLFIPQLIECPLLPIMSSDNDIESKLQSLEQKVDALILLCRRLQEENKALKNKHDDLVHERTNLIEKTAIVKDRIKAMIARLKSMGQET